MICAVPIAKTPPSVSCCWFQSAFCLRFKWAVNTHASSLWNFCQLSILEFKECLKEISYIEIFSISPFTKNCCQKFADQLNLIWYRLQLQVTEATNGFTFQIINSWMESRPGLTVVPPSETCELVWAIFAFTAPCCEIWCSSLIFFFTAFATERSQRACKFFIIIVCSR